MALGNERMLERFRDTTTERTGTMKGEIHLPKYYTMEWWYVVKKIEHTENVRSAMMQR